MRTVTTEEYHRQFMKKFELIPQLEAYWDEMLPSVPRPKRDQFEMWIHIHRYDPQPLRYAIRSAARRLTRTPFNDDRHPVQYCSAVALSYLRCEQREVAETKKAA
jgi:hypothetical protein